MSAALDDPADPMFDSWRTCEHCQGTGKSPRAPALRAGGAPDSFPSPACVWCKDGRYPASRPDSTTLTPEQLAEVLRPLRLKA